MCRAAGRETATRGNWIIFSGVFSTWGGGEGDQKDGINLTNCVAIIKRKRIADLKCADAVLQNRGPQQFEDWRTVRKKPCLSEMGSGFRLTAKAEE